MATTWPLTGRAEELSLISGLTRRRDGPAGVVLAGAAGVGKTRLAREALAAAEQRGALTRWAVATASARTLPLGAFAATLGVVGPDPARLVRQASDALLAGAGKAGVIVGVDDAHLLDELSAMLVHQLALRRAATVVLTLRTGETAPDAVTALWKDGHLARLELQPLSQDESVTLVEATLGGPVDSVAARRLWTITRGNALYLQQLVDGELESSRLRQVGGVWQWSGKPELSPGLVELVRARIGELPDAQRDVIEVLAFGEPLGVPLLAGLTDVAALEQVKARGLIEVYPDGRRLQARLAHPLYSTARCSGRRWASCTLGGCAVRSRARWPPPVPGEPVTPCAELCWCWNPTCPRIRCCSPRPPAGSASWEISRWPSKSRGPRWPLAAVSSRSCSWVTR